MPRFLEALHSGRVLLMDGGMGTELQRDGLEDGECGELWNLTHPERVRAIHQAYVDAGAQVLLCNTFQANARALGTSGTRLENIQKSALTLARDAAGEDRFVLADIGPLQAPSETTEPRALENAIPDLGGVDALLLETWSDPLVFSTIQQCRIVSWCESVPIVPILLSLTYERLADGTLCTFSRLPPEWFALQAENYGCAALGVNCGRDIGMDEIVEIVRRYRKATALPLFARPNAGTPTRVDGRWVYPLTPEQLALRLPELLEAGVSMVGGCCGTTPEHIAALCPIVDAWNAKRESEPEA